MTRGKFGLSKTGGKTSIGYEDYNVEFLGGCDYEAIYSFDVKNSKRLEKVLGAAGEEDLIAEITEKLGECLDKGSFAGFCNEKRIRYELFTWIS